MHAKFMPKNSLRISIKVIPDSKNDEIAEFLQDLNGMYIMRIKIKQSPHEGKANEALVRLLSEYLELPKSHIDIIAGYTSKQKIVEITDFDHAKVIKKVQKNLFS
jgi:uncharacterized protein (TIGR00251 family)